MIFFSWKTFLADTVLFLVVINILSLYIIMTEGFRFNFKKTYIAPISILLFSSAKNKD